MKIKKLLISIVIGSSLVSCATIFNGKPQKISIHTANGDKIRVIVQEPKLKYGVDVPSDIFYKSPYFTTTDNLYLLVDDKCYENQSIKVDKSLHALFYIDIMTIWGAVFDFMGGTMWSYEDRVFINPKKKPECIKN